MRILTVRQPWAWAIIHGGKDVENRVRNIAGGYRGPVAIHAAAGGSSVDRSQDWDDYVNGDHPLAGMNVREVASTRGGIIGVVDLVSVHDGRTESLHTHDGEIIGTAACSPWAQGDAHHLVLANPRALAEPIPYRGALGLRRLDDDTTARILAQIGDPT